MQQHKKHGAAHPALHLMGSIIDNAAMEIHAVFRHHHVTTTPVSYLLQAHSSHVSLPSACPLQTLQKQQTAAFTAH
jgi:hypothetical protein